MGRDQTTDVERWRQQRVHDRELVIRFVLGVGVHDDSPACYDHRFNPWQ